MKKLRELVFMSGIALSIFACSEQMESPTSQEIRIMENEEGSAQYGSKHNTAKAPFTTAELKDLRLYLGNLTKYPEWQDAFRQAIKKVNAVEGTTIKIREVANSNEMMLNVIFQRLNGGIGGEVLEKGKIAINETFQVLRNLNDSRYVTYTRNIALHELTHQLGLADVTFPYQYESGIAFRIPGTDASSSSIMNNESITDLTDLDKVALQTLHPAPFSGQVDFAMVPEFYLALYSSVARNYAGCLNHPFCGNYTLAKKHIIVTGRAQGYMQSPFFDPKHYISQVSNYDVKLFAEKQAAIDGSSVYYWAWYHWAYYGQYEGRIASPIFDPTYYLNKYPQVRTEANQKGLNPYSYAHLHYSTVGLYQCSNMTAKFNPCGYIQLNRNVYDYLNMSDYYNVPQASWQARVRAMANYVKYGIPEGRPGICPEVNGMPQC